MSYVNILNKANPTDFLAEKITGVISNNSGRKAKKKMDEKEIGL